MFVKNQQSVHLFVLCCCSFFFVLESYPTSGEVALCRKTAKADFCAEQFDTKGCRSKVELLFSEDEDKRAGRACQKDDLENCIAVEKDCFLVKEVEETANAATAAAAKQPERVSFFSYV